MTVTFMANLKQHTNASTSFGSLITNRFSRHPERYLEIFRVLHKYELHHVAAQFGFSHRHEEEDEEISLNGHHEEEEDHAAGQHAQGQFDRMRGAISN